MAAVWQATVVTCGLMYMTEPTDVTIEGLLTSEVDAMFNTDSYQAPCVTDADGFVEMQVIHHLHLHLLLL